MAELQSRVVRVTVGDVQVLGLRVAFAVRKTVRSEPNNATVSIWNLAESTRRALQEGPLPLVLEAGYQDNVSQIFRGDVRYARSSKEGPDWVTTVESGDGDKKYRSAMMAKSLRTASFEVALKEAANALGVGLGNTAELARTGKFRKAVRELTQGVVLQGRARDVIERLTQTAGLEWSIQDGQLQFLKRGEALRGSAIVLAPDTGLIGSPELQDKGAVRVRCLLQPDLIPGKPIVLRSQNVEGQFRCRSVTLTGDTHGNDFVADLEAKPL